MPQFSFRLDSSMWGELDRKLVNPVVNTRQIVIHQSLAERFIAAFSEAIAANPTFPSQDEEMCIGCMQTKANVKLVRRCEGAVRQFVAGGQQLQECVPCFCRPMWCIDCLAKWFAARQDKEQPETWLSSRAPCPTCRSAFCILDVSLIRD